MFSMVWNFSQELSPRFGPGDFLEVERYRERRFTGSIENGLWKKVHALLTGLVVDS